jgi:hypothetical protein
MKSIIEQLIFLIFVDLSCQKDSKVAVERSFFVIQNKIQGRNHEENFDATTPMVGRICPRPPLLE